MSAIGKSFVPEEDSWVPLQQNRERGDNVIDVENDFEVVSDAIKTQINHGKYETNLLYGDGLG